jgi:hypothetical protein
MKMQMEMRQWRMRSGSAQVENNMVSPSESDYF